ncbi:MAG TPA: universal stress protein, partial [Actinomycetota bacterium]|nr:universal stress protein [Actinomycetota bacterium]
MYERIVAGTDLSATAKRATDRAFLLSEKVGAELVLLHAGRDPGAPLEALGSEYGAQVVAVPGPPVEVLISETQRLEGDLLVIGSVGMTGARRFLLGNVPNKVSHHAPTDLLIVKTDAEPRFSGLYSTLLVGVDGSPTSMRALDAASSLAATLGIKPAVVCAYEPLADNERDALRADESDAIAQWGASRTVADTPSEFRWRIAAATEAEDVLERAVDHAAKFGVEADARAVQGAPAEV